MDEEDRYTRITLRIPKDVHSKLLTASAQTSKSMNAEIINRVEKSFSVPDPSDTLQAILRAERAQALAEGQRHVDKRMLRYLASIYQIVEERLRPIAQTAADKSLLNALDAGKLVADDILAESEERLKTDFQQIIRKIDDIDQELTLRQTAIPDQEDQTDDDYDSLSPEGAAKAIELYRRVTKK